MAQVIKMDGIGKVKPAVMIGTGGASIIIPVNELIPTAEALMNAYQEITGGNIRFRLSAEKKVS